ncbi:MAG: YihY/virulence factor BrkB family protein [Actinomycetota bacterium]
MRSLLARLQASKAWRAWKRYSDARGNILAAGIGYFAFFSIFPAVALAFTVYGFVLGGHPGLLASVADSLNANLPGFVQDAQHPDGLIPIKAPQASALTITGVIAFVALVLAGMGWLGAVREGIREVFGAKGPPGSLIATKLRDLAVLFTIGLGIALSAVLTTVTGSAAGWIAERIGMSGEGWIVKAAGFVISVAADTGLMMLLLRVLSGVRVPWRHLSQGALVGGVGFSLLKLSASTLLPRVTANPLFASVAIVVGLLFWVNLIARLTLISAAWAAGDADDGGVLGVHAPGGGPDEAAPTGAVRAASDPVPALGGRSGDRVTLAAGAVLGAFMALAAGALAHGIRTLSGLVRR